MAEENKYVEGKKNSRATKTARKLWVEDKIRTYQRELEGLDIEIASDDKVITKLDRLDSERETLVEAMVSAQRRMTALEGEAFDATLDTYMGIKAKVAKVEAEMRSAYYGR